LAVVELGFLAFLEIDQETVWPSGVERGFALIFALAHLELKVFIVAEGWGREVGAYF
jgi:hypothetical protein